MEEIKGELVTIKKEAKIFDLSPKKNCKFCLGRGVAIRYHPDIRNKRLLSICACVHLIIPEEDTALKMSIDVVQVRGEVK